jgi:hypothetical protein
MAKSAFAKSLDHIQGALGPRLRNEGFRVRGRTFNRTTNDGLTHVVNFQIGPSDPPGTTYIPGLRENLYGLFAVNLGVYVPEVARHTGGEAKAWIQDYDCCIRVRLGALVGDGREIWWHAQVNEQVIADVTKALERFALPFLERLSTRDQIITGWNPGPAEFGTPPRIVSAIILAGRGSFELSRALLSRQVREAGNPGHADYVRELALALSLVELE